MPLNIAVCVKRVPDTAADKNLDPTDFTLERDPDESILNPVDEVAVEEALRLKEAHEAEVTVVTIGPEAARRYASGPLVALRAAKALVNRSAGDIDVGLDLERHAFSMLFGTEDWRTGAASLEENGPGKATFSGR